jgi:hypothetical protein
MSKIVDKAQYWHTLSGYGNPPEHHPQPLLASISFPTGHIRSSIC